MMPYSIFSASEWKRCVVLKTYILLHDEGHAWDRNRSQAYANMRIILANDDPVHCYIYICGPLGQDETKSIDTRRSSFLTISRNLSADTYKWWS